MTALVQKSGERGVFREKSGKNLLKQCFRLFFCKLVMQDEKSLDTKLVNTYENVIFDEGINELDYPNLKLKTT